MDNDFNPDELPEELVGNKEPLPWEKDMSEKNYSKYQISKFLDDKRQYQVVVRVDSYEELIASLSEIKPLTDELSKKVNAANQAQQPAQASTVTSICATHNVPMVQGFSKKNGKEYWSHTGADGARCFGKGFLPKQ